MDTNATLNVLRAHAARYPLMQPTDAVKLLYQNEFGGGHLVSDDSASLARLKAEQAALMPAPDSPAVEDIGNGLVRVHLSHLAGDYSLQRLNRAFVHSSQLHKGDRTRFLHKLDLLREHRNALGFTFSQEELDAYLTAYAAADYSMVSHSTIYREAYHPAYRVILRHVLDETTH